MSKYTKRVGQVYSSIVQRGTSSFANGHLFPGTTVVGIHESIYLALGKSLRLSDVDDETVSVDEQGKTVTIRHDKSQCKVGIFYGRD